MAATHKEFYVRATVREGGRSYPVRRYPSCLSAARPARDRAFYVPRLVLGVGTPRARNSECHSRHSFTHNACRPALRHGRVRETQKKKRVPNGTLSNWRLPPLPQYPAVQYHRRCCLSALCSLCCPRPSPLRCLPPLPAPPLPRAAWRTPHPIAPLRHR